MRAAPGITPIPQHRPPMITIDPPSSPLPSHPPPSKSALTRFLKRALITVGLTGQVDVLLTTDAELKRLNRTFRGKNKSTDVLSFPADPIPGLPTEAQTHAGDLAISLDTAARQATRFGHTLDLELRILLLHGLLHLAGHDHETDTGEMAALESNLRTRLKLPTGLIDRTLTPDPRPGPSPAQPALSSSKDPSPGMLKNGATSSRPKPLKGTRSYSAPASPSKTAPSGPKRSAPETSASPTPKPRARPRGPR